MFRLNKAHLALFLGCLMNVSANAALIHDYQLNGDFADALGGPDAIGEGGSLDANGYRFDVNQGLTFSGLGLGPEYSIATRFSFDTTRLWRKIIDYKNLESDRGLYVLSGQSRFYNLNAGGPFDEFADGELAEVVLTRSLAGIVNVYVNGIASFRVDDSLTQYAVVGADDVLRLFQDDRETDGLEASAGYVDYVRIYDTAIVPGASVPAPAALALLLLCMPLLRRRANRVLQAV